MHHSKRFILFTSSLNLFKGVISSPRSQHAAVTHSLQTNNFVTHHRTADHRPHKKRIQRESTTVMILTNHNPPPSSSWSHSTTRLSSSPSTSHQRRLRSIISRSKVSVVRSRSPPFLISSRKHFTSTSSLEVYENIFVLQDISQTHLSIYLLISLIRSEKTFATSLKSMTFHAIYPILSTSLIEYMMDIYFLYITNEDQNICIFST